LSFSTVDSLPTIGVEQPKVIESKIERKGKELTYFKPMIEWLESIFVKYKKACYGFRHFDYVPCRFDVTRDLWHLSCVEGTLILYMTTDLSNITKKDVLKVSFFQQKISNKSKSLEFIPKQSQIFSFKLEKILVIPEQNMENWCRFWEVVLELCKTFNEEVIGDSEGLFNLMLMDGDEKKKKINVFLNFSNIYY